MDKIIGQVITKVPYLFWPVIIGLAIYGLITFGLEIHGHYRTTRKSFIDELKEHLDFKGQRLDEYIEYTSTLEEQYRIQSRQAKENLSLALNLSHEKEILRQQMTNSTMMALWMYEREKFVRRILVTLLDNSNYPPDISEFLMKNIDELFKAINHNDHIHSILSTPQDSVDMSDHIIMVLNHYYRQFSISDEQKDFTAITELVMSLPSLSVSKAEAASSKE